MENPEGKTDNPLRLDGRFILITGASGGIGRATAVEASRLGARVSAWGRNEEELRGTLALLAGTGHEMVVADLARIEEIEGWIGQLTERAGPLDGFAHCAGFGQNRPLAMTKNDFVRKTLAINFEAFAELLRCLGKKGRLNAGASLVGVSSVASLRGDKAQGAYAAAKAAMNGLVPPVAKELGPRGIRVNAVAFGMVATGMHEAFRRQGGGDGALSGQYLGMIQPVDAARMLCFLLSDGARILTGSVVAADNGFLS